MTESERIVQRIDELLKIPAPEASRTQTSATANELLQGALTLLSIAHGPNSQQAKAALDIVAKGNASGVPHAMRSEVIPGLQATLRNLRAEVEAGLIGSVLLRSAGESVADILAVAKELRGSKTDSVKKIGAALVAVAFEDSIRRMGASLAGVVGRPQLSEVLVTLKDKKVITGASATTAQGYLKFRNDALHADWASLDEAVIGSCLAYTELLLLTHFA
jgi:hypothetical protein